MSPIRWHHIATNASSSDKFCFDLVHTKRAALHGGCRARKQKSCIQVKGLCYRALTGLGIRGPYLVKRNMSTCVEVFVTSGQKWAYGTFMYMLAERLSLVVASFVVHPI